MTVGKVESCSDLSGEGQRDKRVCGGLTFNAKSGNLSSFRRRDLYSAVDKDGHVLHGWLQSRSRGRLISKQWLQEVGSRTRNPKGHRRIGGYEGLHCAKEKAIGWMWLQWEDRTEGERRVNEVGG